MHYFGHFYLIHIWLEFSKSNSQNTSSCFFNRSNNYPWKIIHILVYWACQNSKNNQDYDQKSFFLLLIKKTWRLFDHFFRKSIDSRYGYHFVCFIELNLNIYIVCCGFNISTHIKVKKNDFEVLPYVMSKNPISLNFLDC
jgi:hypothetical protein